MFRIRHEILGLSLLLLAGPSPPRAADIAMVEAGRSAHARQVGAVLQAGGPGGIRSLSAYQSTDWLTDGFLHAGDPAREPEVEYHDIQNHSWVGQSGPAGSLAVAVDALRRLDHAIVRDGFTAVVSLDNGGTTEVPELLGHGYNVITVGRLDGEHSRGGTWLDGSGRTKPDLVGVMPATSLNVPAVSAAAALLLDAVDRTPDWVEARRPEAIKAILMASADKTALPIWDPGPGDALDPVFGAGVLDPGAALAVLQAGPQSDVMVPRGWQVDWTGTDPVRHRITVPEGTRIEDLSVALVWNREVTDTDPGPGFQASVSLPDLNLTLSRIAINGGADAVAASSGDANNLEYLFLHDLRPGGYLLDVSADTGGVPFALAWNGRPMVDRLDPPRAD